ncbi:MAG: tetratricopeptide repeat protein [Candidatus Odinarchaeota archaeon]
MSEQPENVKIHFAYVDHSLNRKLNLRRRLLAASEEERLEIIKHASLHNLFLIKRRNITFSNLFYYRILTDRYAQNKLLPELYKILSERFLPDNKLEELATSNATRAYPSLNIEPYMEIMKKFTMTNVEAIRYLKEKEAFFLEEGDLDMAMATRSLLKEFSPPGLFTLNDLFTDKLLAKYSIHPLRYDKFYNRYVLQEVHNFSLYNLPRDPSKYFHLTELNDRIAEGLVKKLINFVHENLGLKPDIRIFLQYSPLFNHLLSIASSIFFEDLHLEEKLDLINKCFTVKGFIEFLDNFDIEDNYEVWRKTATTFNVNGTPEYALEIMNILEQKWIDKIKEREKYQFYDTLATINRNLQNYDKALFYYKKAWDNIEKSETYNIRVPTTIPDLVSGKAVQNTLDYRKGVCLKNIGESYGHLNETEKLNASIEKSVEIAKGLKSVPEKFSLYGNIAFAYRRLHNFEKEREYLKIALDFIDVTIPYDEINKLEERILQFEQTSMNTSKLSEIDLKNEITKIVINAKQLQNSFFFQDSISYYLKTLHMIEENEIKWDRSEILMEIGFSYYYMHNWSKSEDFFKQSLDIKQVFEIKMFIIIVLIKLKKFEQAKSFFEQIGNLFNEPADIIARKDYTWLVDLLNFLNAQEIQEFIDFKELLSHDLRKLNFITALAVVSANNGFSKLAIQLFNETIKLVPNNDKEFVSSILNNIGTVHVEEDNYDGGINYFKKGLEINEDCRSCLFNMANAYVNKLEFEEAKKYQKELVNLLRRLNSPEEIITFNNNVLEYIDSLLSDILNIEKIDIEEVKGFLITAESFYLDYKGREPPFDASPIVTQFSKSLERLLHDKVSIIFNDLIEKYRTKSWSKDFRIKFGNLFTGRTISLGTWVKIIEQLDNEDLEHDVREFSNILKQKYNNETLSILKNASSELSVERNPRSHYESLSMKQVVTLRKNLVRHLNLVINLIY